MSEFVKMSSLVDGQFTITGIQGFKYKMWDPGAKKMQVMNEPTKGFRKVYQVETDKGILDLGTGQIGAVLEALLSVGTGEVKLFGSTVSVKSNGKTGMDIRYFFDGVDETPERTPTDEEVDEPVDLTDIPF